MSDASAEVDAAMAQRALELPVAAVLARMMRLGWGMYYQAQAELRQQLAAAGWSEADIATAVLDISKAEQFAVRTNGPPSLAELDSTLNAFGRGLVAALAAATADPAATEE